MTIKWLKAATVRAVKTAAQTAIGAIGAAKVFSEVDWKVAGGAVLIATITSYLTSLTGLPEASEEGTNK